MLTVNISANCFHKSRHILENKETRIYLLDNSNRFNNQRVTNNFGFTLFMICYRHTLTRRSSNYNINSRQSFSFFPKCNLIIKSILRSIFGNITTNISTFIFAFFIKFLNL